MKTSRNTAVEETPVAVEEQEVQDQEVEVETETKKPAAPRKTKKAAKQEETTEETTTVESVVSIELVADEQDPEPKASASPGVLTINKGEVVKPPKPTHFDLLSKIDVSDKIEKKKSGSKELSYLSWAWAWAFIKTKFPDAHYEIERFGENNVPYLFMDGIGYIVFTSMTIEGITHTMWLPVMDGANKAMKKEPYSYFVQNKKPGGAPIEKHVEAADMFDINKTIMRCLVKNIAMYGLGLSLFAGEDLPLEMPDDVPEKKQEPEPPSELEETIAEIHKRVLELTKGMDGAAKVAWANKHITPTVGGVNYKAITEIETAKKLLEIIKGVN